MDYLFQRDRLNWIKKYFILKNNELAYLAGVHPSQVSNWIKSPDHKDYQDITKIRAIAISIGTEGVMLKRNIRKRVNWTWISGWNKSEKRKKGEVINILVNENNIWDYNLFDPLTLEETIEFVCKMKKEHGVAFNTSENLAKEIVQIYQEKISGKVDFESMEKILNITKVKKK